MSSALTGATPSGRRTARKRRRKRAGGIKVLTVASWRAGEVLPSSLGHWGPGCTLILQQSELPTKSTQAAMTTDYAVVSESEVEGFAELYVEVFNAPPWRDGWTVPVASERLLALAQTPRLEALGAFQDGKPVGLVLGNGERWVNGWVLHIREMFVASALQRGGVGRRLLAEFEASLAGKYTSIYLQTDARVPAHAFYASCGYTAIDLVSMRKHIGA